MSSSGPALLRPRSLTHEETRKLKEFNIPTLYERFADYLTRPFKEYTIPYPRPQLVSLQSKPTKWSDHGLSSVQAIDDPELAGLDCNFSIVIGGAGVLLDFVRDSKRTVGNSMAKPVSLPLQARAAVGEGNATASGEAKKRVLEILHELEEKRVIEQSPRVVPSTVTVPRYIVGRRQKKSANQGYDNEYLEMATFREDRFSHTSPIPGKPPRKVKWTQLPGKYPSEKDVLNFSASDEDDPLQVSLRGALPSPNISYFRVDIIEKKDTILSGIVRVVTVPEGESCRPWSVNDEISFPPLSSVLHGVEAPTASPARARTPSPSKSTRTRDDRSKSPSRRSRSPVRQRTPESHHRTTSAASLSHRKQGIYGMRSARTF